MVLLRLASRHFQGKSYIIRDWVLECEKKPSEKIFYLCKSCYGLRELMHQCFGMVKLKDLELQDVSKSYSSWNLLHWIRYWFQCKTSIYCWVCLEPTRIHRNNGRLLRPLIFGKGLLIDNCLNAGRTFAISSMGISLNVDFRFWTLSIICLVCIGFVNQIFTGLTKMLTMYQHCLPIQCLMFMYGLDKNLNTEA